MSNIKCVADLKTETYDQIFFDNTKNNDSLFCWYGDLTMPNIPTAMTMVCGTGAAWERKLKK